MVIWVDWKVILCLSMIVSELLSFSRRRTNISWGAVHLAVYPKPLAANKRGEANRLAQEGVFIGTSSERNYIALESGNILLNPEKDIVIGTDEGKICIKSGAAVFVAKSDPGVVT